MRVLMYLFLLLAVIGILFGKAIHMLFNMFYGINLGARCYSKIGFVGLGNMGGHMARNLLKKGYKLTVYDVNKSAVTNLVETGASCASDPAEMSKEVEVVISMLPSNEHVLDVYTGKNGVFSTAKNNVLLIDSSTVDPSVSQLVASQARERNLRFIDGPVSGGVNAAKDGTLTFMVGGSETDFNDAKSILETLGSRIVHCGDVGMGQAAKLCNNMLLAISMIGTAEAFNLGQKMRYIFQVRLGRQNICGHREFQHRQMLVFRSLQSGSRNFAQCTQLEEL
ncbi:putative 3-hydroxyisobutyrate dehydrogenase, mitochondrial isoform X6 [Temnothorax americanus]|uniref:putative 3-hydroxyisobutyrate dehydrogenase, mitochondrial isoform X6 n=1 Tax=Temnothorax americanus TaxID=1964332 RepID=UPI0040696F59